MEPSDDALVLKFTDGPDGPVIGEITSAELTEAAWCIARNLKVTNEMSGPRAHIEMAAIQVLQIAFKSAHALALKMTA